MHPIEWCVVERAVLWEQHMHEPEDVSQIDCPDTWSNANSIKIDVNTNLLCCPSRHLIPARSHKTAVSTQAREDGRVVVTLTALVGGHTNNSGCHIDGSGGTTNSGAGSVRNNSRSVCADRLVRPTWDELQWPIYIPCSKS